MHFLTCPFSYMSNPSEACYHPPRASHTHPPSTISTRSWLKSRTINPLPSNTLQQTKSYRSHLRSPSLPVTKLRKRHTGGLGGQSKVLKDIKPLLQALCWPMDLDGNCYVKYRHEEEKVMSLGRGGWNRIRSKTLPGCFLEGSDLSACAPCLQIRNK